VTSVATARRLLFRSAKGQTEKSCRASARSASPLSTDLIGLARHVGKVLIPDVGFRAKNGPSSDPARSAVATARINRETSLGTNRLQAWQDEPE
jgi:hypothetical protein